MKKVIHREESRGVAEHGWLHSRHSFSFASYYNPERMGFGKLRVINDDVVDPGAGFGTHPHDNMEIISIPLSGGLRHKDSMGNEHVIQAGEIQAMSAGTGISHSEYNNSSQESVKFLQIWVIPGVRDVSPRYGQKKLNLDDRKNKLDLIVSPKDGGGAVWIYQNAWFSLGQFSAKESFKHELRSSANGLYIFVIDGEIEVDGEVLHKRDAMGLTGAETFVFNVGKFAEVLLIEVPMQ